MYDLVVTGAEIAGTGKPYNIGIKGRHFAYIGTEKIRGKRELDGRNYLATSGLVNAHTHVGMTLLRGYADDMELMEWLQRKIWPAEEHYDRECAKWGSYLGIAEMLRSGVTTFADFYDKLDVTAECVLTSGMRASLGRGFIADRKTEERILDVRALCASYHGAGEGRLRVMIAPHAPYTCPVPYLEMLGALAQELGVELHMHLCETQKEVTNYKAEQGVSPIVKLEEIGLLDLGMLAAHCVYVDEKDIAIMARHKVRVAHNPQSNLKLASGVAPVAPMLKAGITVALGTDGASSNNNLDVLEEMRLAAYLAKERERDAEVVPAQQALEMGTSNGYKALGYENVGEIKVGQEADLVLWDMTGPQWYPHHNNLSNLIYAANSADAATVIVAGKILMEKRELLTIDLEKVCAEAERCALGMTRGCEG